MKIHELNETPIEDVPKIKFRKKDDLQNKRKMKPVAWHATLSSNADKILRDGSRASFSLTGNYEEAVDYAFQRAGSAKRDATVLAVDTSYIQNKETGRMYAYSGSPHYFEVTHPMPPEAFSVADTLSYRDVIGAEKRTAKKVMRQVEKQLPDEWHATLSSNLGTDLLVDAGLQKVKNYLLKNGWTLADSYSSYPYGMNYILSMDSHELHLNWSKRQKATDVGYRTKF